MQIDHTALKWLAKKLGLKTKTGSSLLINRFGSDKPVKITTKTAKMQIKKIDGTTETIDVSVVEKITGNITRMPVKEESLKRLTKKVTLADPPPQHATNVQIDMLIGNEYYLDFVTDEKIEVAKGLYLLGSEFGWIISGRTQNTQRSSTYDMSMCGITCGTIGGLDDLVATPRTDVRTLKKPEMSDLWSLETIGINDDHTKSDDQRAIEDFETNITRDNDNRYVVSLPWNDRAVELQTDYGLCHGRLTSLMKKLPQNEQLFKQYSDIIEQQEKLGILEKIESDRSTENKHYIPHHAVVKPDKETTKVRIVFDGSAKANKAYPSLNKCLFRGPILLEGLAGLLMRFRLHPIAIISQIEKAFLQIGIRENNRDKVRFLWLKDPTYEGRDIRQRAGIPLCTRSIWAKLQPSITSTIHPTSPGPNGHQNSRQNQEQRLRR